MADNQQNPAVEPLQKGAQAANAVRGAVKTGKAIAGAAQGAAAGGPYGAILGFAWENRKLATKVIIAAIAIIMIPVIVLCMLPSIIFDGWGGAPASGSPIINDNSAIQTNLAAISSSVSSVLSEGINFTLESIEKDFAISGADETEIINPYASSHSYDVVLFISQYCAYRNRDCESISVADMETVLRQGLDKLYSYTKVEEYRAVPTSTTSTESTSGTTSTEATELEHWIIYTIEYNGESYFADEIFFLTDEQKALAVEYAHNLTIFLSDMSS